VQRFEPYLDTCILMSLLVPDSGSSAALHWFSKQEDQPIWLSHWTWLEFTGVLALCCRQGDLSSERLQVIHQEAESFRRERLSLVEVVSADFLRAQAWLQQQPHTPLRSDDALHLAIAQRTQLRLHTADQQLLNVAAALDLSDLVQAV
jgi:predicted nucleic acid-binding protein